MRNAVFLGKIPKYKKMAFDVKKLYIKVVPKTKEMLHFKLFRTKVYVFSELGAVMLTDYLLLLFTM